MNFLFKKSKAHLHTIKEGYIEHFIFASWFSWKLLTCAIMVFTHALIPALFEYNGSRTIEMLHAKLQRRRNAERV
jgi:hypothetical protein